MSQIFQFAMSYRLTSNSMLFERPAPYLVLLCGAVHFLCERQTSQVHTYWWAGWRKCHIPWVTYDGRESSGMRPLSANTWFVWDKSFFVSMLYWLPRRAGARFKRKIFAWVLAWKIAWILAWDSIQEECKRKEIAASWHANGKTL